MRIVGLMKVHLIVIAAGRRAEGLEAAERERVIGVFSLGHQPCALDSVRGVGKGGEKVLVCLVVFKSVVKRACAEILVRIGVGEAREIVLHHVAC